MNSSFNYDTCNSKYENSDIDVFLENEYFNSLPRILKDSIIPTRIQQNKVNLSANSDYVSSGNSPTNPKNPGNCTVHYCFKGTDGIWRPRNEHTPMNEINGSYKYLGSTPSTDLISRKIFLPSVEEIGTITKLNSQKDINEFMTKIENKTTLTTRDMSTSSSHITIHKNMLAVETLAPSIASGIHPTFTVDLSKISYTVNK